MDQFQAQCTESTHPAFKDFIEKAVSLRSDGGKALANQVKISETALSKSFESLVRREQALTIASLGRAGVVSKIADEIKKLCNNPHITEVKTRQTPRALVVQTNELTCNIPGAKSRVSIGVMRIEISITGEKFGVRVENLTRKIDAGQKQMQAPLIDADGRCHSAQLLTALPSLLGKHEYSQIVNLVIQSIERVDPAHSWSTHVKLWPEAKEGN